MDYEEFTRKLVLFSFGRWSDLRNPVTHSSLRLMPSIIGIRLHSDCGYQSPFSL